MGTESSGEEAPHVGFAPERLTSSPWRWQAGRVRNELDPRAPGW
jgi:hypothetical protein